MSAWEHFSTRNGSSSIRLIGDSSDVTTQKRGVGGVQKVVT